jgi:hypothetical protein
MSEDVFKVTDSGLKRTHYDRVHLVDDYSENKIICEVISCYIKETQSRSVRAVSVGEIEDEFLKKTDNYMWIGREFRTRQAKLGKAGVLASLAIYHFLDRERAQEFCSGYKTGAGLALRSPILALRKHIMGLRGAEVNYWRAQTAMRAHLHNKDMQRIDESVEDMLGTKNSIRLINARSEKGRKAAATRYGKVEK